MPDANVLVDFGRNPDVKAKLVKARHDGSKFVIAPPTLTELSVGVVKGGAVYFAQNEGVFAWLQEQSREIRKLPEPFMVQVLGSSTKLGDVRTHHQLQRIGLIADSMSFEEFLQRKGHT